MQKLITFQNDDFDTPQVLTKCLTMSNIRPGFDDEGAVAATPADLITALQQDDALRSQVLKALLPSRDEIGEVIEHSGIRGMYPDWPTACKGTAREIGRAIGMPDSWLWAVKE